MRNLLQLLTIVACMVVIPTLAQAESIITHSGQTDPTTEGWSESIAYNSTTPGTVSGTGVDDGGTDAWRVETDHAWLRYIRDLDQAELDDMNSNGWEASITMRLATTGYTPYFDSNFEVATDNWVTSLLFGTDASGNPQLSILDSWTAFSGAPIALPALDPGYHTYKLTSAGDVSTVSLYVDDSFVTDLTALPVHYGGWEKRILWGDTERGTVVLDAYYADVAVSSVPEPSTLTLLLASVGMALMACRRYR